MKKTPLLLFIYLAVLSLSGCISAGIYTAQQTVATIDGSKMTMVVITPKQRDITAINDVEVDLKYYKLESKEKTDDTTEFKTLLIADLKEQGLYKPDDLDGDKLKVHISNITSSYSDKSVQSFVEVFDKDGTSIMSVVYVMNGKGLRRLSYVKERFAEVLAEYLKKPAK